LVSKPREFGGLELLIQRCSIWLCWGSGFGGWVRLRTVCGRRFSLPNTVGGEAWDRKEKVGGALSSGKI